MSDRDYADLAEAARWIQRHAGSDAPEYPSLAKLSAVLNNIAKRQEPDSSKKQRPVSPAAELVVDLRHGTRVNVFSVDGDRDG